MITLIDNYDSFTWNLVHYLGELGAKVRVYRNDAISAEAVLAEHPAKGPGIIVGAIVLSPGPCDPNRAGICLDLIAKNQGRVPMLGVCLGHQAIGQAYGGKVIRAPKPMHGKLSRIHHDGKGLFVGVTQDFQATRYHSLVVDRESLPAELVITAESQDGMIMGLRHRDQPVYGVQFHPESIATEHGHALLKNFLELSRMPGQLAA